MRKILITSALPYANGSIHLGHLVEYIQTDIWSRFQRMNGNEVFYVCADDAHGTPIMIKAQNEGLEPKQLIDNVHKEHSQDFNDFHINFDNFYSTDSDENKFFSEEIFKALNEADKITSKEIEQFYDNEKGMFLPDRFIKGECPKCNVKEQYGDSCEACGATYSPTELINPFSVLSGSKPIKKKTKHFFFKLSDCEEFLKTWTSSNTLQPEAENKIREWFKSGLKDWDITRDKPYFGFLIPGEKEKYFYVWLDAPIGYMASFKNLLTTKNLNTNFDDYWLDDKKTELYHFIGKDILYFHALFWPATLNFSGYRLPTKIFAHGFLTINGEKMSKSRGTFITARSYLNHIKEPEYLRYYYASKLNDSMADIDLNFDDMFQKVNSDLIGKLINIPSRTFGFIHKHFDGKLKNLDQIDQAKYGDIINKSIDLKNIITHLYEVRQFSQVTRKIFGLIEEVNEFINSEEPWKISKDIELNRERLHDILTVAIIAFRNISIYLSPILPQTSKKIAKLFNEKAFLNFAQVTSEAQTINRYDHLLQRVDKEKIELLINNNKIEKKKSMENQSDIQANLIDIKEFQKVDVRVAKIKKACLIDGADSLISIILDVGELGEKNVIAGIKSNYDPSMLEGKNTVFIANLKPRKMKFGLSEGMILAASDENSGPFILFPDEGATPGMKIK
jgi:methionyl-tRNA synthetase